MMHALRIIFLMAAVALVSGGVAYKIGWDESTDCEAQRGGFAPGGCPFLPWLPLEPSNRD